MSIQNLSLLLTLNLFLCSCRTSGYFKKDKMTLQKSDNLLQLNYHETNVLPTNSKGFEIIDWQYRPNYSMSRGVFFRNGRISSETLGINDSMCYVNLYGYYSNRILLSFCVNKILNRIDGIVLVYNKKGDLDICAEYENSVFKNVVYYRNKIALKNFIKGDKTISYRFSY